MPIIILSCVQLVLNMCTWQLKKDCLTMYNYSHFIHRIPGNICIKLTTVVWENSLLDIFV